MCAAQRKIGVERVIEADFGPAGRRVAIVALDPVVAGMEIISPMAGVTRRFGRLLELVVLVAGPADQVAVPICQSEARFLEVVEAVVGPAGWRMAALAGVAVGADVHIVHSVTVDALAWRLLVELVAMTARTSQVRMLADERKLRRVVVENCIRPPGFGMTVAADFVEIAFVRIDFAMAGKARRLRFVEGDLRRVTVVARDDEMAVQEQKIRRPMIERVTIESNDVCVAALVFRMTRGAFESGDRGGEPVETTFCVEVLGDLRVTVNAQVSLEVTGEQVVAGGALVFVFRVTFDHGSGHEQPLEHLPFCPAGDDETNNTHGHSEPPKLFLERSHFTFPSSIHVYGEHVDQCRQYQDVKEWKMKKMPEREHTFIESKRGNAPNALQVFGDELRDHRLQLISLRRDPTRFRLLQQKLTPGEPSQRESCPTGPQRQTEGQQCVGQHIVGWLQDLTVVRAHALE